MHDFMILPKTRDSPLWILSLISIGYYLQEMFAERIGGNMFGKDTTIYKFEKIKRAMLNYLGTEIRIEFLVFVNVGISIFISLISTGSPLFFISRGHWFSNTISNFVEFFFF